MDTTIRPVVRAVYDLQKVRISVGNRIAASFHARFGINPSEKVDPKDPEDQKIFKKLKTEYKRITDGYIANDKKITKQTFTPTDIFRNYAEFELVSNYFQLLGNEERFFNTLAKYVEATPLWNEFLVDVRGIGPAMTGVLLSEVSIEKCTYASTLWKYAGLAVEADGQGQSRKEAHLVDREYIAKDGSVKTRKSITFNPFLKTKLVGVLGPSFLKQPADKCKYRKLYDDYKHRLQQRPDWQDKTDGHRHNAAVRYAVKMFLLDLWVVWRKLEGLPTPDPYHVAKLGLQAHPGPLD